MSVIVATSPASSSTAADLWCELEEAVHESCVLRCAGRLSEASQIVDHTLPLIIRDWSRVCGLSVSERKQRLQKLFKQVQERVATAVISRRLAEESMTEPEARQRASGRPMQLSRRVPIDDVAGMLDALAEVERRWAPSPQGRRILSQPALARA